MLRDRLQILFVILRELINFYSPLKSSENQMFFDDFRGNRSLLIRLNSSNIRNGI